MFYKFPLWHSWVKTKRENFSRAGDRSFLSKWPGYIYGTLKLGHRIGVWVGGQTHKFWYFLLTHLFQLIISWVIKKRLNPHISLSPTTLVQLRLWANNKGNDKKINRWLLLMEAALTTGDYTGGAGFKDWIANISPF